MTVAALCAVSVPGLAVAPKPGVGAFILIVTRNCYCVLLIQQDLLDELGELFYLRKVEDHKNVYLLRSSS